MFCLGCGAELPPRAERCAVCGKPLEGSATDVQWSVGQMAVPYPSAAPSPQPATPPFTFALASPAATPAAPGSGPGTTQSDLDAPGLPRDAAGRALLITALALLLDLLAPWINLYGTRWAPAQAGTPIFVVVVLLGLALTPLTRPALRKSPLAAAAPLAVGAAGFGAAALLWASLALGAGVGASPALSSPGGLAVPVAPVADFGLYLFLFGACVLMYTGYQLFLIAARATSATQQALLPMQAAQMPGAPVPATVPLTAVPVAALGWPPASPTRPLVPAMAAPPLAPPPPPPGFGAPAEDAGALEHGRNGAVRKGSIALPGSSEWSTTPETPTFVRPSPINGWRRPGGLRH